MNTKILTFHTNFNLFRCTFTNHVLVKLNKVACQIQCVCVTSGAAGDTDDCCWDLLALRHVRLKTTK